jgi:hypothetical protein
VGSRLVWMGLENLPSLGFNLRAVQPIASQYTNDATLTFCKAVSIYLTTDDKFCFGFLKKIYNHM